jgi:ubiquinone/menaquinone biosynthesis C-methylase UbiE
LPWIDLEANRTLFLQLLAPRPNEKILDAGAGRGVIADLVRTTGGSEVYATDSDKERMAIVEQDYPSLKTCVASAESIPYPDAYFDKVYSTVALHHFSDQRRAIQEFARLLKPGGLLLIVEINPQSRRGRTLRFLENGLLRSHLRFLKMEQLAQMVKEEGRLETKALKSDSFVYFVECVKATTDRPVAIP